MHTHTTTLVMDEQRSSAIAWLAIIVAVLICGIGYKADGWSGAFVAACLVTACVAVAGWWDQALDEARKGGAVK